jgi:hypothetical protein
MTVSGCTTINAVRQFRPSSRGRYPKESVARPEAAPRRSVEGRRLLPQRQVFQDQFPMAVER